MLARWNATDLSFVGTVVGSVSGDPADCLVDYLIVED
jgi:hypothetical protein